MARARAAHDGSRRRSWSSQRFSPRAPPSSYRFGKTIESVSPTLYITFLSTTGEGGSQEISPSLSPLVSDSNRARQTFLRHLRLSPGPDRVRCLASHAPAARVFRRPAISRYTCRSNNLDNLIMRVWRNQIAILINSIS